MDLLSNMNPTHMYINKKIYLVVIFLVIVGGINWLAVGVAGVDLVKALLGKRLATYVYIIVGLAALLLAFRRDVYLPFLGQAHLPAAALDLRTPQSANETVEITTRPGAKVVYWAAEPDPNATSASVKPWNEAYGNYENSGVAQAGPDGKAILRVRGPPQPYKVPMKGKIEPHIHFRIEESHGMMGRVMTYWMSSKKVEGFSG